MRLFPSATLITAMALTGQIAAAQERTYPVTDTLQDRCFDLAGGAVDCPAEGEALYGQDAQYSRTVPDFTDNGDGTVSDTVTGLLWQKTPTEDRLQYAEAIAYCTGLDLGGRSDWRVPSIKELYSLADFRGELLRPEEGEPTPYIDTSVFDFSYPDGPMAFAGQYWSSTLYVKGPVINGRNQGAFGFNFADGHIKSYGTGLDFYTGAPSASSGLPNGDGRAPGNFVRCVAGDAGIYGVNAFTENGDGTVTDTATGLMWQQADDGTRREWAEALAYCEALELGGHADWRLPDSKALQSIVDYDRTSLPAIDPVFAITQDSDTLDFWTSTTFGDIKSHANVIVFGLALSKSADQAEYTDWHGSGAQRSSIKTLTGQDLTEEDTCSINACDVDRPDNLVRCVR
ncbi:Lcl C-terminal domain-containing protein [Antarctobacter jejuensis]|uniref:Lcl C-terminal domain-containing protein n=1 Tax=Antarctobacter jejuensis TaxID=1439938 RepID=UPI003FD6660A